MTSTHGPYADPLSRLPMRDLYVTLREHWLRRHDRPSFRALAEHLGTTPQNVTSWATASDSTKHPPWWVCLRLAADLGYVIVVTGSGFRLLRVRTVRLPGDAVAPVDLVSPIAGEGG